MESMEPFHQSEVDEAELAEAEAGMNPIALFARWFETAVEAELPLPEAAALATATPEGRPSCRMVLMKGFGPGGFVFFTNYESRKASELEANPRAALTFNWTTLQRSVRVEGRVERTSPEENAEYFGTRPRDSQIGAWASPQSREIGSREELEERADARTEEFEDRDVPLPPFWGGYRVIPERIEFWQGRVGRLHDRLVYESLGEKKRWTRRRLAP